MESLFPQILFLGPYFGPLVLRVAAALAFFVGAKRSWGTSFRDRVLSIKEIGFGVLLLAGFLTQLVAIVGIILVIGRHVWPGVKKHPINWAETVLFVGILATLVITGAGAFAVDLPY